jgi:2-dehydro-3-deoxyphosphogluconate aldolase/(4S)-4-hydroxy-2-oxoglutarate aldolase
VRRPTLPGAIAEARVVPVLRGLDPERVVAVADALLTAGIGIVEVTMDSPGAVEAITLLSGGRTVVGAGTVRSVDQAKLATEAGAAFLVSPHTDLSVVDWAASTSVPFVPGVMTPTEAMVAWNAGAAAVKVFPASVVGPSLLRAMRGPLPDLVVIPTGGITAADARSYIQAGAVAVGVGGWLTDHDDLAIIRTRAGVLVEACRYA